MPVRIDITSAFVVVVLLPPLFLVLRFKTPCRAKKHFFVRDLQDIANNKFSEPAGLLLNSDASNFMKIFIHSFLSKEGVFADFPEGLRALALTINDYQTLNMLLGCTNTQMIDIYACEL